MSRKPDDGAVPGSGRALPCPVEGVERDLSEFELAPCDVGSQQPLGFARASPTQRMQDLRMFFGCGIDPRTHREVESPDDANP